MQRHATVWSGSTLVGTLRESDNGQLLFRYDVNWLVQGFPISLTLPFSLGEAEQQARSFFAGLLPEGQTRSRICKRYRLPEADDVGLLLAIGRDCAGALSVLPADQIPNEADEVLRELTNEDLQQLAESRGQMADAIVHGPQRFSLAGAQDKIAVIARDGSFWLPNTLNPSSHILKFETVKKVCFAELMALELARRIGLRVSSAQYRTAADGSPYLLIERYDRSQDASGKIHRLHQEDFAQALGFASHEKYEEEGGPSFAAIVEATRRHTDEPVKSVAQLRDWQILNYLIGNFDGHAKNLALLYQPGQWVPELAPFYDLVCIEFLSAIRVGYYDRRLAFAVGAHNQPEHITRDDWQSWAKAISLPPRLALARVEELCGMLPDLARDARQEFAQQHGDNQVYGRFEDSVESRCRWTLSTMSSRR